ncbi:MAG: hypothetical protein ACI8UG_001747 [Gammaproteobacteria bacterium]|jgi:hypothetical protein
MFTMKNVILGKNMFRSLVLASSLILSAFSVQAGVILSFGEDDIEVGLNETFTVELYADTGSTATAGGIGRFNLDLSFDNSIINLDSFSLGGLFGAQSSFGGTFTPIFSSPFLPPTLVAIGNDILLGTFTFTATEYVKDYIITISGSFENILIGSLEPDASASASISVVSAPATLSLFSIALVGLIRLRRKA